MAGEIKTRLIVDGEQAFNREIKAASQSISRLGSNLTLAAAEFRKDGDAMKLMQTRSATLRAEIAQQREIVKALQGALSDVTQKYGENSKQAEEWQAKLNQAKAKMANLEVELRNNEQGLDKNGRAFQGAGAKAQQFGKDVKDAERTANGINFMAAHTAIQNLSNSLSSVFRTALNVGKRVVNLSKDSGQWADELGTLSLQTGLSTDTLQKWAHAAEYAETDVSTITKAFVKLTNPTEKVQQTLKKMGVTLKEVYKVPIEGTNIVDLGVRARDTNEIFWDTIEALGRMKNATDQEAAANEIFGKSFQQLMPLVRLGRARWQELEREAADMGLVIGEDGVQALNDYYDSTRRVEEELTALKNSVFAELAPGMKEAADGFTQLVQNFNAWAQSEKGQEALGKLSDAIGSVFSSVTDQDFEGIVGTATGAIEGLTGAFGWFSENGGTVRDTVLLLAAALAKLKVDQNILSFLALVKSIKWQGGNQGNQVIPRVTGAGNPANNAASVPSASASAAEATGDKINLGGLNAITMGGKIGAKLANGISSYLTSAFGIINTMMLTVPPIIDTVLKPGFWENTYISPENWIPWKTIDKKGGDAVKAWASMGTEAKQRAMSAAGDAITDLIFHPQGFDFEKSNKTLNVFQNAMTTAQKETEEKAKKAAEAAAALEQSQSAADRALGGAWNLFSGAAKGEGMGDTLQTLMDAYRDFFDSNVYDGLMGTLYDTLSDATADQLDEVLQNALSGENLDPLQVAELFRQIFSELDQTLSSQTQSAGKNASDGLAAGILAQKARVEAAAEEVAEAAAARIRAALQIQSPSRVMKRLGAFVSQGFAEGIEEASGAVQQAVNRMAGATAARPVAMGYGGTYNNQTYHSSRSIYIDKYNQYSAQDVDGLMEAMESVNRYERQGRGA